MMSFEVPGYERATHGVTPPISTITIVSGWTEETTVALRAAVAQVVEANPLLGGKFVLRDDDRLFCEAGHHSEFIEEIAGPAAFSVQLSALETCKEVHRELEPLLAKTGSLGNLEALIEHGGKFFRVLLMPLPESHMAMQIDIVHMLVDGHGYYNLCECIHCATNGLAMPKLTWAPSTPEIYAPVSWVQADKEIVLSLWDAILERSKNYEEGTPNQRVAKMHLLDTAALAALKEEFVPQCMARGVEFVSTNDLYMAAVSELVDDKGVVWMATDMRTRVPGLVTTPHHQGLYIRLTMLPASKAAVDPSFVRAVHKTFAYYAEEYEGNKSLSQDPEGREAWLSCNLIGVTNLASFQRMIEPPGTKVVCHCPQAAPFAAIGGMDCAFVFKIDTAGTLAVIDNFSAGKRGDELKERIASSKIFSRLCVHA